MWPAWFSEDPGFPKSCTVPILAFEYAASANTLSPSRIACDGGVRLFKSEQGASCCGFSDTRCLLRLATLVPFVLWRRSAREVTRTNDALGGCEDTLSVSFAGCSQTASHLRRTRWGSRRRATYSFAVIAAMPVLPFFALSDFGRDAGFLWRVCNPLRRSCAQKAQFVYALLWSLFCLSVFLVRRKSPPVLVFRVEFISAFTNGSHLGSSAP